MAHKSTKLTQKEQAFINAYMEHGNGTRASKEAGYTSYKTDGSHAVNANRLLKNSKIAEEIKRRQEAAKKSSIATAQEVMEYFTRVMNGEEKDQFGLDAPLGERTKAAQELAKRTIDLENRLAGKPDGVVSIKLDWDS